MLVPYKDMTKRNASRQEARAKLKARDPELWKANHRVHDRAYRARQNFARDYGYLLHEVHMKYVYEWLEAKREMDEYLAQQEQQQ